MRTKITSATIEHKEAEFRLMFRCGKAKFGRNAHVFSRFQ